MGAVNETDTGVPNKWGAGQHGWTNGDEQAGIPPSQFDELWCDQVQQEINSVIFNTDGTTPVNSSFIQLAFAIDKQFQTQYARVGGVGTQSLRCDTADLTNASMANWLHKRRSQGQYQKASNTVQTWCLIGPVNSSQFSFEFRISVVDTTAITTGYGNAIIVGSARQVAGAVTIQSSSNVLMDVPLAGMTLSVVASGAFVAARCVIPAAPAARVYNLQAIGIVNNVTQ